MIRLLLRKLWGKLGNFLFHHLVTLTSFPAYGELYDNAIHFYSYLPLLTFLFGLKFWGGIWSVTLNLSTLPISSAKKFASRTRTFALEISSRSLERLRLNVSSLEKNFCLNFNYPFKIGHSGLLFLYLRLFYTVTRRRIVIYKKNYDGWIPTWVADLRSDRSSNCATTNWHSFYPIASLNAHLPRCHYQKSYDVALKYRFIRVI